MEYAQVAAQRRDTVSRGEFEARVREALDAFSSGQLHKVVLARRMLLDLVWEQDSVELLRQACGMGKGGLRCNFGSFTAYQMAYLDRLDFWGPEPYSPNHKSHSDLCLHFVILMGRSRSCSKPCLLSGLPCASLEH
eukprot:s1672_g7.t1